MMAGARIVGFGGYQPDTVVTNDDLAKRVDTNDEWIRSRVGIASRRIAGPDESVTDMAVAAGGKALAAAGLTPADIDLVIVATCSSLVPMPSVAAVQPLVSVASPVPAQWAACPMKSSSPLVKMKLLVQVPPPAVSVLTPGRMGAFAVGAAGAVGARGAGGAAEAAGAASALSAITPIAAAAAAAPRVPNAICAPSARYGPPAARCGTNDPAQPRICLHCG